GLADTHLELSRYDEATTAYQDALAIYRTIGDRLGQANVTQGLAHTHHMLNRYDEATTGFRTARDLYAEIGISQWAEICQQILDALNGDV
ncbi:tetratricopeptide repeat protein, partial [Streptomyces sp. NPDC058457]|uniref:tetratricopeptide repeat protein n=1 Tax=Streptomyces sp. NPDC058457 TaxID=3346507 RepID=UPI0036628595